MRSRRSSGPSGRRSNGITAGTRSSGTGEAMSQVARVVGETVGLQWGTSRTYAAAILAADAISDAMDAARDEEAQ